MSVRDLTYDETRWLRALRQADAESRTKAQAGPKAKAQAGPRATRKRKRKPQAAVIAASAPLSPAISQAEAEKLRKAIEQGKRDQDWRLVALLQSRLDNGLACRLSEPITKPNRKREAPFSPGSTVCRGKPVMKKAADCRDGWTTAYTPKPARSPLAVELSLREQRKAYHKARKLHKRIIRAENESGIELAYR